jgi:hypothetical protein
VEPTRNRSASLGGPTTAPAGPCTKKPRASRPLHGPTPSISHGWVPSASLIHFGFPFSPARGTTNPIMCTQGARGVRPSFGSPPGVSGSRLSLCHSRRNSSGVGSSRAVSHSIRAYCHALLSSPDQRSTGSFETELVFICTRNLATGRSANHEAESPSNAPGSDGDNKSHALKRQDILRLTCSMYGWDHGTTACGGKRCMCRVIWLHRRKQGQGGDDKDAPPCPCGGNGK